MKILKFILFIILIALSFVGFIYSFASSPDYHFVRTVATSFGIVNLGIMLILRNSINKYLLSFFILINFIILENSLPYVIMAVALPMLGFK
jgi:hypothetical protein